MSALKLKVLSPHSLPSNAKPSSLKISNELLMAPTTTTPPPSSKRQKVTESILASSASLIDAIVASSLPCSSSNNSNNQRTLLTAALSANMSRLAPHVPPSHFKLSTTPLLQYGRTLNLLPLPSDIPPPRSSLATPPVGLERSHDDNNADDDDDENNDDSPPSDSPPQQQQQQQLPKAFEEHPPGSSNVTAPSFLFNYKPAQHRAIAAKSEAESERITLNRPCEPPPNETATKWHGKTPMFFAAVTIVDADEPDREFKFDLTEPLTYNSHGACFNIGIGNDGSPLISYSIVRSFYQLPDGSMWAEHEDFYDSEDLDALAKRTGNRALRKALDKPATAASIPDECKPDMQLVRRSGRFHSRLETVEEELYVYDRDEFARRVAEEKLVGHVNSTYWYHAENDPVDGM